MTKESETGPITAERYPVVENRRKLVLNAALALNEDGTDSLYLTREQVIIASYSNWFSDELSEKEKKTAFNKASLSYVSVVTGILKAQESLEPVSPLVQKNKEDTRAAIKSTEGLPDDLKIPEELTLLLRRNIDQYTFSTLLNNRKLKERGILPGYTPPKKFKKTWNHATLLAEPEKIDKKGVVSKKSFEEITLSVYQERLTELAGKKLEYRTRKLLSEIERKVRLIINKLNNRIQLYDDTEKLFYNELFNYIQKLYPDSDLSEDELYRIFGIDKASTNSTTSSGLTDAEEQAEAERIGDSEKTPEITFLENILESNNISREENAHRISGKEPMYIPNVSQVPKK